MPREIGIMIVGTGKDSGVDRMVDYLATNYQLPITVVTFDVFQTTEGQQILAREVKEGEVQKTELQNSISKLNIKSLFQQAEETGSLDSLTVFQDTGIKLGLYLHPWKNSLVLAPQEAKNRALCTLWVRKEKGKNQLWVGNAVFSEYFNLPIDKVKELIGNEGYLTLDTAAIKSFCESLTRLLRSNEETS